MRTQMSTLQTRGRTSAVRRPAQPGVDTDLSSSPSSFQWYLIARRLCDATSRMRKNTMAMGSKSVMSSSM